MGAGQDLEAGAGDGGEKGMAHSSSSGPLPPSEPPHLRGQDPAQYQYGQQQQPYAPADPYYAQGYQAAPGYGPVVQGRPVEGRPMRMRRLPCCGLGMGWLLFIAGFFFAAIPWYIGAFILICVRVHDHREKPGYVACTVAAIIAAIVIPLGVTKGTDSW
ncbi:60S ribosomal protein L18a-like protein [Triticum dicoccoides]|uniref:60S ribosomal protein L18a-like protein n=1 Tax=Triticum dicoccoides TaxID=85692 RepID=UPI00188F03F2|nr:60S ribosomal protein L18a-like protein [Triticum dicoccoides]